MRNLSCVMSATRPFTCSVCDQPCTASLMGSGGAWPASLLWPDGALAQGVRSASAHISCVPRELKIKSVKTTSSMITHAN